MLARQVGESSRKDIDWYLVPCMVHGVERLWWEGSMFSMTIYRSIMIMQTDAVDLPRNIVKIEIINIGHGNKAIDDLWNEGDD